MRRALAISVGLFVSVFHIGCAGQSPAAPAIAPPAVVITPRLILKSITPSAAEVLSVDQPVRITATFEYDMAGVASGNIELTDFCWNGGTMTCLPPLPILDGKPFKVRLTEPSGQSEFVYERRLSPGTAGSELILNFVLLRDPDQYSTTSPPLVQVHYKLR